MTGAVVLGAAMVACVLAGVVVGALLMRAESPCDGSGGVLPPVLLIAAVLGSGILSVTAALTGPGRVAAVAAVVGVPAGVIATAWTVDHRRFRGARAGVR